jgi:hypothetical protein
MSNSVRDQHKGYIEASLELGDLTLEELGELGSWCVGKAIGTAFKTAWASAMSDDPPDQSDDPESRPKTP